MIKKQLFPLIIFLIFAIFTQIHAQTVLHIENGCHFAANETPKDIYSYDPSKEAVDIISRITTAIGLEQNYTIRAANVSNALASTEGGQRYILYNTTFLENFKRDAQTKWAAYCVLAHEIGHHLNNHDFSETDAKKRKLLELAADRFAGNILQKMGATLAEAQAGINTFSLDETKTHPPKSARLEAIAVGWKQSKEKDPFSDIDPKLKIYNIKKAQEWLDKAFNETDDNEKIKYITTALEYKPDDANALFNRGNAKGNLGRFAEAIEDFDASIRLNSTDDNVFHCRGSAKKELKRYAEAIADFDQAIRLNADYSSAFHQRGNAKLFLARFTDAVNDFDESIRLQPFNADVFSSRGWAKVGQNRNEPAILDFDEAIRLNPNQPETFNGRGWAKFSLGRHREAILDFDQAIELRPTFLAAIGNRGWVKYTAGQFIEAIADFDKSIAIDPNFAKSYANKGCSLVKMNDKNRLREAIDLIDKALKLDNSIGMRYAQDCKIEALKKIKN